MKISGRTRVLGIIGHPVRHSLSPVMQNAAIESCGLDLVYVPFEVMPEDLGQAIAGIRAMGIRGVNVTVPHKEKVIPFLDEITDDARIIGAVNTIENSNGALVGHNTDSTGYIRSLQEDAGFEPTGKTVAVIGAGGGARAVITGLATEGVSAVTVLNRTLSKAEELAEEFASKFECTQFRANPMSSLKDRSLLHSVDLVINCTSMGLAGESPEIDFSILPKHALVSDITYKPLITPFLTKAEGHGLKIVGGFGMLLYQGASSFEIWTGQKAPVDVMKKALSFL